MKRTVLTAIAALMVTAPAADAKDEGRSSPLIAALGKCLAIADDRERLACTDAAARALVEAERRREIVVVDRDEVKKTRRSLFGLTIDENDVFAGRDAPQDRIEALDTTIASARTEANDRWTLTLAEGGRWRTTEAWVVDSTPKPGWPVSIRRGALGSYVMKAKSQRAVRVMRVN